MVHVALIDNYDSFTWNLVHLISSTGAEVSVYRNDAITVDELKALQPEAIILSPGPCTPNEAGICLDVISQLGKEIPLFGVCLGMQAMGQAFGGHVIRAPHPMHGKISGIEHGATGLFRGINGVFQATRYHSLIVDRATLPDTLSVTAEVDGLIMALSHKNLPIHGVQFHPESILSDHGETIIRNFLDLAADWNTTFRQTSALA